jgi:branched-chain amino acid transport system permease protein
MSGLSRLPRLPAFRSGARVTVEERVQALRAVVAITVPLGLLVLLLCIVLGAAKGIQYTLDSISYGSIFALLAMGLALLFGVMGLMNFAYGELIMAGAYTMYFTRSWGWVGMIAITIVVVTVLSLLMELLAFRPLRRASPVTLLITSFAVSYALQELAWTDVLGLAHRFNNATIGTGPQKGFQPYPWLTHQFSISGVLISKLEIAIWIVTLAILLAMTLLLRRTTLGIQLRASTDDFRMAQLVGVRANWVISAAFGITGLIGGAAALLYVFRNGQIAPDMGQGPLFIAFVGGVIGGLGSLSGAALGGFVLGVLINILNASLPFKLHSYALLFAFVAVIAIVVFQPDGLISVRGGALVRAWRRFRKPVAEGATA